MLSQRIVITGLASLLLTASAQGVTFYLSDKGLGEGATPGNVNLNMGLGDTFTLYVWGNLASGESWSRGAVDLLPSNPNVLGATGTVLQNPAWQPSEEEHYQRWAGAGATPNATTGDVYRFAGGTATGGWVTYRALPRFAEGDPAYEAGAGYLLGSVTYSAQMARTGTLGLRVSDFTMSGSYPLYFGTGDGAVDPTVGRATSSVPEAVITVGGAAGPYPMGDGNHDGTFNSLDIGSFVAALTTGDPDQADTADTNRDGSINALDIGSFVTLLTGGTLPGPQPRANLLGDCDHDGFVRPQDASAFVSILVSGVYDPAADINQDGCVNPYDISPFEWLLLDVMLHDDPPTYGGGGGAVVPEPGALSLLVLSAAAILRRRR